MEIEIMEIENPEEFFLTKKREIPHSEKSTILSSSHVVHFTPKFETLKLILKTGFRPALSKESPVYQKEYEGLKVMYEFLGAKLTELENINIPMTCFCDIPLKYSNKHRKEFGKYGIALTKSWAISKYISPVLYLRENTQTHTSLFGIINTLNNAVEFSKEENPYFGYVKTNLAEFLDFVKPYYDDKENKKYYDEREWRYVPRKFDETQIDNPDTFLKFESKDIVQIIVTCSKEKREITKLLKEKFNLDSRKLVKTKK